MMLRTIGLISILVYGLLAGPLPVDAQQAGKVYRIGYLSRASAQAYRKQLAAFQQGLRDLGYVEGKNILIEERYAVGRKERLPELAAELVRLKVDIFVVQGGQTARAARQKSKVIPIVFAIAADPVGMGVVASFARPGGNVTGLSDFHGDLVTKRLELLKEVVPSASRVAVLWSPDTRTHVLQLKDLQAAAPALGVALLPLEVRGPEDFDRAFSAIRKDHPDALNVLGGPLNTRHLRQIADFALKSRLPAIYTIVKFPNFGGLMSYGTNFDALYRRAAYYVDRILKGTKPADLPVEVPTKFDLVINLKTAKQIGVEIPPSVLFRADKVIK